MTSGLLSVQAVIFDLDDTLFDDTACTHAGLRALTGAYPGEWTPQRLFERHAQIIRQVDPLLFRGDVDAHGARVLRFTRLLTELGYPDPDGEAATQLYRRAYRGAWTACEGAVEVVRELHARGLKLAVLTNYVREVQQEKAAHLGLLPYLDTLLCVGDVPAPKPDPGAYRVACQRLGVLPAQALMVGDSWENDVQGALSAGLRAVWVNRPGANQQGATAPHVGVPVIRDLRALPALLP